MDPAIARNGRSGRRFWLIALGLAIIPVASLGVYVLTRTSSSEGKSVAAATWVSPQLRQMDSTVTTSGTVRLRTGAEVRVGSQVSGIVEKLHVTVGSHIQKGDIIAEIDPRPLQARAEQARTQAAMDEVAVSKSQRDLSRGQQLFAEKLLPSQQLEDLEWQVKSAQAKLNKSKSDLAAAIVDLSYAEIRAPISGTVASVSTQEGETVAASFAAPTFVTIIEDNALELVALVDETDIANVRSGDAVTFTVEAYSSLEIPAVVKRIDPVATIISGVVNYAVMATIQKDSQFLKPDMTANITIRTAEHKALVVPNVAIQRDGEEKFVRVLKNGKEEKQSVLVGMRDAEFSEIRKGLSPNDRVMLSPPADSQKKEGIQ
jgi:RND family efflux transporter MFP subunit